MSVSGSIETVSPLAANLNGFVFTPLAFTFNDGVQTISVATLISEFEVSTNAFGEIIAWDILVANTIGHIGISKIVDFGLLSNTRSYGRSTVPGQWQVNAVPLPAAFPLLCAGLASLGAIGWMRKRRTAA